MLLALAVETETLPNSFVSRVRRSLNDLPVTERRLAEFSLDFPGELASYTASELAKLANVSNATVSRFIKRIGYKSYEDARRQVRAEKRSGSPLLLSVPGGSAKPNLLVAHLQHGHSNLTATFNRLSEPQVNEMARAIVRAQKVWVFGYRSSQSFASYFRWQIVQFIERVHLVPGPGETLAEHLVGITDKDVVVIFALRRRVAQIARIAAFAAAAGARILFVTDHHFSDGLKADWLIRCDCYAPGPLDNHVAVMALCDLLITKVCEAAGVSGRKRLSAVEVAHDTLQDL
ncbi:MAG TPA: MurR/RpiR family transcriptional regulator [Pseudolabrys sp.]|nr:MurR/RpiR family transcriptional regulator [Pseudolabrys sp.]